MGLTVHLPSTVQLELFFKWRFLVLSKLIDSLAPFFFFKLNKFLLAASCSMRDPSSPTRDGTCVPMPWKHRVLTNELPEKSLLLLLSEAFCFRIDVGLWESCKDGTGSSCLPLAQFTPVVIPYVTVVHWRQLRNQCGYVTVNSAPRLIRISLVSPNVLCPRILSRNPHDF